MAYPYLPPGVNNLYARIPVQGTQACWNICTCKLKVEGTGKIKVRPDISTADLGVITENIQLGPAQRENSARIAEVIKTLTAMGIPPGDIQTRSYSITPQYDYVEGRQIFRGYRVEHMLEVTMKDMNKIGEIVDAAVQSGVNQVAGIRFSVANPQLYYKKALDAAINDALSKARALEAKLDIQVSRVPVQIVELGSEAPVVPLMAQVAGTATPIQTGQVEITAGVEAIFAYLPVGQGTKNKIGKP